MIARRAFVGGAVALGLGMVAGGTYAAFRRDVLRAERTIAPTLSRIVQTRHGPLEYADVGAGAPLLMLHGTGGGFDQGLLMAGPFTQMGYRVIAPSRFGYLRAPMPNRADQWTEAEAMIDLLNHLGLDRVAVAGVSAGAIPALACALRFPDRCVALMPIVPVFHVPGRAPVAPWGPVQQRAVAALLASDFLFWAALRGAPDQIIGTVLATDPALVHAAAPAEAARVRAVMDALMPISRRAEGLLFDGSQANRDLGLDLAAIRIPTLALSCEDDRYRSAENARLIAATTPRAQARIFADGGHVWVGHNSEMFAAMDAFARPLFGL
jgi:pimeloyl-ACP methyl ester carboxylesterase